MVNQGAGRIQPQNFHLLLKASGDMDLSYVENDPATICFTINIEHPCRVLD